MRCDINIVLTAPPRSFRMASSRFSSYRKSYRDPEPQPKDEIESDDEEAMLDIRFVYSQRDSPGP